MEVIIEKIDGFAEAIQTLTKDNRQIIKGVIIGMQMAQISHEEKEGQPPAEAAAAGR